MLLRNQKNTKIKISTKSLSHNSRMFNQSVKHIPLNNTGAKALQCGRRFHGSLTVEACLAVPIFLFVMVFFMGFFSVLKTEMQVTAGMQYAARMMAVSYQGETLFGDTESSDENQDVSTVVKDIVKSVGSQVISRTEGRLLFNTYVKKHGWQDEQVVGGLNGISFLTSDLSGDYIILRATYKAKMPITICNISYVPVRQNVKAKKWNGASKSDGEKADDDGDYVYVTPTGSVYHTSDSCSHIKLSLRTVLAVNVENLRNKSGGKYYACSCYKKGSLTAYVTDYGEEYHSDTSCGNIKRTVIRKSKDEIGSLRACSKCGGE